jgi:hypothetical protein
LTTLRTKKKGATYPLRELAEFARQSVCSWTTYASKQHDRPQLMSGAHALAQIFAVCSYILHTMADVETQDDVPPPPAHIIRPKL